MPGSESEINKKYGKAKFGETISISLIDFERSFKKYFSRKKRSPHNIKMFGRIRFGEIKNTSVSDFKKSFIGYFF